MAILAYLSGRRAALRGSGMRSNFADSFAPLIFNPAFEPRRTLSKIGHPLRRPQSRASVRQTERVLLRTTFAQGLCARPLRTTFAHLLFPISLFSTCGWAIITVGSSAAPEGGSSAAPEGGPVLHQREGPVLHQRGSKWRERPPRLRIPLGSGPPWLCASRGSGASLPTGGRSRHSDPCGKARIAEG